MRDRQEKEHTAQARTAGAASWCSAFAGRALRACFGSREDGGSVAEFAFVFPMYVLVLVGITSFGLTLNNYVQLTEAVNVAGRKLAIDRNNSLDPCSDAANAVYAAAPGLKKTSLVFTFSFNGTTYSGTSCSSTSYSTGAAGSLQTTGGSATITVTYPPSLTIWGVNFAAGRVLTATTTELVQ